MISARVFVLPETAVFYFESTVSNIDAGSGYS